MNLRRAAQPEATLRIPPFPGALVRSFVTLAELNPRPVAIDDVIARLRQHRVGGTYWGHQPHLPERYLLVRSSLDHPGITEMSDRYGEALWWPRSPGPSPRRGMPRDCDPWHMLASAEALVCEDDDEVGVIAALLGVPTFVARSSGGLVRSAASAAESLRPLLSLDGRVANPFDGKPLDLVEAIELCGFWRRMVDANRELAGGIGFAFWKQKAVLPLLWGGGDAGSFFSEQHDVSPGAAVAVWRSRAAPKLIERFEAKGVRLVEVEDGFLRSKGLGADCVPPLSITVDRLGAHFDPAQPSELERLLQDGLFDAQLIARARGLRATIVAAGLGKYDSGEDRVERGHPTKRHILVAGQVEDDRSIMTGGFGLKNLDLLRAVREANRDAFLIYKPHPDVVAGHRKGDIPEHIGRQWADCVVTGGSIASLIAMVDEVHVNTSLAGFEALMRDKAVTTYGVPFYAGWGLTTDLGPVPERRTARRTLDELVAAALLLYPRYLDPVTGLPAPAEVVVDRLIAANQVSAGNLIRLRRLQGRLNRGWKKWLSK